MDAIVVRVWTLLMIIHVGMYFISAHKCITYPNRNACILYLHIYLLSVCCHEAQSRTTTTPLWAVAMCTYKVFMIIVATKSVCVICPYIKCTHVHCIQQKSPNSYHDSSFYLPANSKLVSCWLTLWQLVLHLRYYHNLVSIIDCTYHTVNKCPSGKTAATTCPGDKMKWLNVL